MMGFLKGTGDFISKNHTLSASLLQGVASAADPTQRALRTAQARNYNANSGLTEQVAKNQTSVGGKINWGNGSGLINAARKGA